MRQAAEGGRRGEEERYIAQHTGACKEDGDGPSSLATHMCCQEGLRPCEGCDGGEVEGPLWKGTWKTLSGRRQREGK